MENIELGFGLRRCLNADWQRLHDFGGVEARPRRFRDSFSPRFAPIAIIRLAHWFYIRGHRRTAKLTSLINFIVFGLEVPARLPMGEGLVIPHTHGTIIGAGFVGRNVTIFHQVTLGAKLADFGYDFALRPHVGNNVTITAGAKILGPVKLGDGCTIGANSVVISDVPANALAVGIPAKVKVTGN
jgi:serine O-acetyltransferase